MEAISNQGRCSVRWAQTEMALGAVDLPQMPFKHVRALVNTPVCRANSMDLRGDPF